MQRAKFVQIYASSFLLKEIKLEAGGLEGEGISISHLNSAFLCGIVTLYERRGIYGGFCHQRKIKPSKSWDFFFTIHHIHMQIFEDSYMYILSQDSQTTWHLFSEVDHGCGLSLWSLSIIITSCNHIREVIASRAIAITAVIMRSLGCQVALPQADWCAQCRSSWVEPLGRSNPKNHPREISYVGIQAR